MSRANRIARLVAIQQGTEFVLLKHQQGKHDQSTHGSWDTDRSNNKKSDFKYGVQDAIDKVVKGKVGKVVPADAEFWLDKMADRKDNPDLTNLEIVGTQLFTRDNLGIMRDQMPQVPYERKGEFISEMEKRGIAVTREEVSPQKLHPIQAEISAKKSGKLARDIKENGHGKSDGARIIVSSDDYIIDGHHRWAASAFLSFKDKGQSIPVLRVDMTHMELIDATLAWNKATGIESLSLDKSSKPFKKAWVEFELTVIKGILVTEMRKHQAGQHDQSTHGSWAGNGLGIEEVMKLQKSYDPLQSKVYDAERSIDTPSANPLEKPNYPKRDDFESREEYDKAYKAYNKEWTEWAVGEQTNIFSDTGEKFLDGTPAGVKKYVENVIKQDWFVEKFGTGSSLPRLDVKTSNTNASGRHILKVEKFAGEITKKIHQISIDRQSVKNERTMLHEISHYATAITQTESFSAHGVEFARNHVFILEKMSGLSRSQALTDAYISRGIEIGN
jgi:hypothetical protein